MKPEERQSLNASVFRVTGNDPEWIGYWINRHQQSEGMASSDAAQHLGIDENALALLCLCKAPRQSHFEEDLAVVCKRTGANADVLARIIRQEQALVKWREGSSANTAGWLLAASDGDDQVKTVRKEPENDDHDV